VKEAVPFRLVRVTGRNGRYRSGEHRCYRGHDGQLHARHSYSGRGRGKLLDGCAHAANIKSSPNHGRNDWVAAPIGEPLRPLRFAYATTEVPADYDDPDTDMLELAVLRAVSTHPNRERIGSMLINPGGAQACVARRRFGSPPRAPDAAVKFGP